MIHISDLSLFNTYHCLSDLNVIKHTILELLDKIDATSYPSWLSDNAPFLPPFDLKCMTKGARNYLLGVVESPTMVPSNSPSQEPSSIPAPSNQPSATSLPSNEPSLSLAPSLSTRPSLEPSSQPSSFPTTSYDLPIRSTVSGFFDAIANSCASDSFRFSGGYDSTTNKLALNVVADVTGQIKLQDAVNGLADMLSNNIFIDKSFFDRIQLLEDIVLSGTFLIDLTIEAIIPSADIPSNYADVGISLKINRFKATASLQGEDLSLEFPVSLPTNGVKPVKELTFALNKGNFLVELFVELQGETDLLGLFSDEKSSTHLTYGASLDSAFPLEIKLPDSDIISDPFGVTLYFNNSDFFDELIPSVDYEIEICPLVVAAKHLFKGLNDKITETIKQPFDELESSLSVNFDKVSDPLIENIIKTITDFSNDAMGELDSLDCDDRRLLQSTNSTTNSSLIATIENAISSVNRALEEYNITVEGDVKPYFDGKTFAVGINSTLAVTITQSAADIIDVVKDFFDSSFDSNGGTNTSKLGFKDSGNSGEAFDVNHILEDTIISAGLDINFLIEVRNIDLCIHAHTCIVCYSLSLLSLHHSLSPLSLCLCRLI